MNSKIYVAMAALVAGALLVGAFALPATVSVAYADSNQIKNNVHVNNKNNCRSDDFSSTSCGGGDSTLNIASSLDDTIS